MTNQFKINPKVKTKSLLEKHIDVVKMSESSLVRSLVGDNDFDQATLKTGEFYVQSAYTAIYGKITSELQSQARMIDSIRNMYLTEVVLNQIADDALAPEVGTDEVFKFSSKDPKVQTELDALTARLELNQLIQNITPDLCLHGEYVLETQIDEPRTVPANETLNGKEMTLPSRGLVNIHDRVDFGTVIPLSQEGREIGYLSRDKYSGRILFHNPADFIKFTVGGSRVKVNLDNWLPPRFNKHYNQKLLSITESIPRFIRIGKSVFFGVYGKIRELEVLEKLVPATKINKLSKGNIIGISLPENTDLQTGMQAARAIEGIINKKVSVDPQTGELTAEAILSLAGRSRVIPLFDKGELSKLDTKDDDADDLVASCKDLRELILDSIGVPSELIYKAESDGSKNEIIKRYSKYIRKVKRVRKAIAEGLMQIALIHLENRGMDYTDSDIEVVFLNSKIEVDNLDKLEFAEATVNVVNNIKEFFNNMADDTSPFRKMIDLEKVAEFIDSNLKLVGLSDAIILKKEGGVGVVKPDDGMGDDVGGDSADDDYSDEESTEDDRDTSDVNNIEDEDDALMDDE